MKTLKVPQIKTIALLGCLLLTNLIAKAQVPVPFTVRYENSIKGDMTLISNNLMGSTLSVYASKCFKSRRVASTK